MCPHHSLSAHTCFAGLRVVADAGLQGSRLALTMYTSWGGPSKYRREVPAPWWCDHGHPLAAPAGTTTETSRPQGDLETPSSRPDTQRCGREPREPPGGGTPRPACLLRGPLGTRGSATEALGPRDHSPGAQRLYPRSQLPGSRRRTVPPALPAASLPSPPSLMTPTPEAGLSHLPPDLGLHLQP